MDRRHREGLAHLAEARAFAEWSHRDRQARLPELTAEQETQLRQYLRMVEDHGISKSLSQATSGKPPRDCVGCPVFDMMRKGRKDAESVD
jgi:hypothetical protein